MPAPAPDKSKERAEKPAEPDAWSKDGWHELADESWETKRAGDTHAAEEAEDGGLQAKYGNAEMARIAMASDPAELEAEEIARHGLPAGGIRAAPAAYGAFPPEVEEAMARSGGHPIESPVRAAMERELHADFGNVHVRDDEPADRAAGAIGARAFTIGSDVFFARGEYAPGSAEGDLLLKHELVHVEQQRLGGRSLQAGPPEPKPVDPGDSELDTTLILELVTKQIELMAPFGAKQILLRQLEKDRDFVASTPKEEAEIRKYAIHLTRTVKAARPVVDSIQQLVDPKLYLDGVASKIVKKLESIRGLYATAIVISYSDLDEEDRSLQTAEKEMTAFPDYLLEQYLSPDGIPKLIEKAQELLREIGTFRAKAGLAGGRRPAIERMLRIDAFEMSVYGAGGTEMANVNSMLMLAGRAEQVRTVDPQYARQLTESLITYSQFSLAALTALALEDQFIYFQSYLDDSWIDWIHNSRRGIAKKYREKFDAVLSKFEGIPPSMDQAGRKKVVTDAVGDLSGILGSKDFLDGVKAISDRIETIETVHLLGKVAVIIAVSALTAGEAGALAGGLIRVAGVTSELVIGGGELVAEALVFTAVQRTGEEFAFGKAEGTFGGDFLTNLAMFGALKGVGKIYGTVFKLSPEAGKFAKIAFSAGKVGTAMLTLHAFTEIQHIITDPEHKAMSGEERYRAILQNIVLTAALEAGRFMIDPIEKRVTAPIHEWLKKAYDKRLDNLQGQREVLTAKLKELEKLRATADPAEISDVLEKIQKLWNEELGLIADAAKRFKGTGKGKISDSDLESTLMKYQAARAKLELQFSRLGFEASFGPKEKPAFRQVLPGVIAFDPSQRPTLDAFYAEKGGTLEPSKDFPDLLEGRIGHEVTFYMPEGDVPASVVSAAKLAAVRDLAIREGHADPKAMSGLVRLTTDLKLSFRSADTLLAGVAPENIGAFLRALADPAISSTFGKRNLESLAKSRKAMDFIFKWGGEAFKSIFAYKPWGDALTKALDLADSKLEGAKPEAQQKLIDDLKNAKSGDALDEALGKAPKPKAPPPPAVTKKNMGVNRATKLWETFRAAEEKYAKDHGETPTSEQLDQRADLLQIMDRAKSHSFDKLGHDSRLTILDAFEELAGKAGVGRGRLNALRGSLAEALFAPEYGKPKTGFTDDPVPGTVVAVNAPGVHVPDYDLKAPDGKTEWVNLKSDLIDQGLKQKSTGAYQSGVDAARKYLDDGKAAAKKIPPGDHVSFDFIRDPGAKTRAAMLDILFGPDSPVHRVKFGTTWYDRASVGKGGTK